VATSLWSPGAALSHIRLAKEADLVVIAPATANLIARAALGISDDLLTAILRARTGPVLVAPAMNDAMFADPATQRNLAVLAARGWAMVGPEVGPLAEGESDAPGRMSEPEVILAHAGRCLLRSPPFVGLRVLVTAGPTREALDPVRVLTNRSSGKMGYRIAEAAWRRGAEVTLVSGPSSEPDPPDLPVVRVESTADMSREVAARLPSSEVLVMAAAPADFQPVETSTTKRAKQDQDTTLALRPTEDILSSTRALRRADAVIVGFALETGDAVEKARRKLDAKAMDLVVVNDALEVGAGFEVDTNRVAILHRTGESTMVPLRSKTDIAEAILDEVEVVIARRASAVLEAAD
jgi:phosphopantothenoylcysteine decarboxylase/phosphopantothenate--cysteine ligase